MNSDILETLRAIGINIQKFSKVSKLCNYLIQAIENPICTENTDNIID